VGSGDGGGGIGSSAIGKWRRRKFRHMRNERDRDGRDKPRDGIDNQVCSSNMHPVLENMMKPVLDAQISCRVNVLCKLAGMQDTRSLPQCNSDCFRWMLGLCEPKENDAATCKARPGNAHPTVVQTPDDCAIKMVRLLQPGIDKLVADNHNKHQRN